MAMLNYVQKKVCLMFNIYFKEMKKFFSLIALVGVFAACQPEQIETAFKVAGAKLTVNVSVVDLDGTEYSDATITSTAGTVSGKTITFEAAENTAIPAQTITVTATTPKLPKTYSQGVSIPEIIAGGSANIEVRMVIGEKVDDYTYEFVPAGDPVQEIDEVNFLDNKHYDTYEHKYMHKDVEITNWFLNDSEYILSGKVDYDLFFKSIVISSTAYYDGFAAIVDAFADSFDNVEVDLGKGVFEFKVSGYGMWAVWQKKYVTEQKYEVKATKGSETITVGEFVVWAYNTDVVEEVELGMPVHVVGHGTATHYTNHTIYFHGHDEHGIPHAYPHSYTNQYHTTYPVYSHYLFGHGVAGGASNAGGGIVWSE